MVSAFETLSDFFAMGGYALYVWLAVVMTLVPLTVLTLHTVARRRVLMDDVARQRDRERRMHRARREAV